MFSARNPPEMDINILLMSDIDDIKNICTAYTKYGREFCGDSYFWHLKFKKDNLPLPVIDYTTSSEWISSYIYTEKMMAYTNHVMSVINRGFTVRIAFNSLSVFHDIVDNETLKKCYLSWQSFSIDYFKDVNQKSSDNDSYGKLYIGHLNGDIYGLGFNIRQHGITYNLAKYNDIVHVLFTLISSYKYAYYINEENAAEIIDMTI